MRHLNIKIVQGRLIWFTTCPEDKFNDIKLEIEAQGGSVTVEDQPENLINIPKGNGSPLKVVKKKN